MSSLIDLQINLNGQFEFFLNQGLISEHSKSLRKLIKQSKKNKKLRSKEIMIIEIDDFPGGSDGFELVSRFCYSNGEILINLSNVSILYCCSVFLEMTNLLIKTEKYLQGIFYWSLNDIVSCLKNSEQVFIYADYYGFIDKLIFVALTKISEKSDEFSPSFQSSSASATSPSPETTKNTPEFDKIYSFRSVSCVTRNEWWFEDMSNLSPQMILKLLNIHGGYKTTITSLVLTRFLLYYLNKRIQTKSEISKNKLEYSVLADKAVQGVIFESFSCRKLFWILRVLSNFNLSKESKKGLETLIGEILDQATLDDLLISARSDENRKNGVYNVDLVIRLLKVFVKKSKEKKKMKEIGELIDQYLREISPDQNLKVSKFVKVAESLPDSARDLFDGVYRAIDIYLQSHPNLSVEEQSKLCGCLNYKKLTLETCKHLARNPKIPPHIAIEALKYQKPTTMSENVQDVVSKRSMVSSRYSIEEPVLLHLKDFEISEKFVVAEESKIKGRRRYRNWRVMDSFRERSKSR